MDSSNLGSGVAGHKQPLQGPSNPTLVRPQHNPDLNGKLRTTASSFTPRYSGEQSSSSSSAVTSQSTGDEDFPGSLPSRPSPHHFSISRDPEESIGLNRDENPEGTWASLWKPSNRKQPVVSTNNQGRPKLRNNTHRNDLRADWSDWESLAVRVTRIPSHTTTFDLWRHFDNFGNVVYIEIGEDKSDVRTGSALVRFSPPPSQAFWTGPIKISVQGQQTVVNVFPLSQLPPRKVLSPQGIEYPQRLIVAPTKMQFGMLTAEDNFMAMRTVDGNAKGDFFLAADLKSKKLEVRFVCDLKDPRREDPNIKHPSIPGAMEGTSEYKINFLFAHLKRLVFIQEDDDHWSLLIPLPSPPALFKKHDPGSSHSAIKNTWSDLDAWIRAADIMYDSSWVKDKPTELRRTHQYIDIGRWTAYKLIFKKSIRAAWEKMKQALQDFNIGTEITDASKFPTVPSRDTRFWDLLDIPTTARGPNANLALLAGTEEIYLTFEVRYQLEVCISQGYLSDVNIDAEFLRKLADLSKGRTRYRDRAVDILTYVAEPHTRASVAGSKKKIHEHRYYEPMAIFKDRLAMAHYTAIGLPEDCAWIRKVIVTPSTIHLSTPTVEPSNRILRRYTKYMDRFLRVQFTDELMKGRIFPSPDSESNNAIFNRVYRTLLNGVQVGGRHFKFLAFGNSQFRENGAYFFCETEHLTCDHIRSWMGEVHHIKVVAKYAARLGQCFSTTKTPKGIPIGQSTSTIPDIEHDGWCFSDGVGKISATLASYITTRLRLGKDITPSAFQFRLGGNKGLLVSWPEVKFNSIELRPSQNKFTSDSKTIEIIKASQYSVATLNRQTITILHCLGVPEATFVAMLKNQLNDYDRALVDSEVAMRLLSRYVDQNHVTSTIAGMIRDGFMRINEPFFMAVLQVWRAWSLRMLREKARIVVEKGAFVFGCIDETFTLRGYRNPTKSNTTADEDPKYPQIFLQVPRTSAEQPYADEYTNYTVITGLCVVGRNPSLHPGDIRVVEAVDVPALRHLKNVVVFPATGDRDIPSMCSGGDLDGDDFFVIWDPNLIPPERDYPPMVHNPPKPQELDRDVQAIDLIQFFVTYMKNDTLSSIAYAHLARADALTDGPKDPMCIELAHLHSNAVDYPKSGRPAHLKRSLCPKMWPHFMERPGKSYHSRQVLGQLYDLTRPVDFSPQLDGTFDERILRRYGLSEEMLRKARIIKRAHDKALRQIMNQREIATEFEVWTTFVMTKPRVGSEYKMQETMGSLTSGHRERFRDACIKVAGCRDPDVLYPMVAATYRVTWEEVQVAVKKAQGEVMLVDGRAMTRKLPAEEMPLISFPWIFDVEQGRVATMKKDLELEEMPQPNESWYDEDGEGNSFDPDEEFKRLVGVDDEEGGGGGGVTAATATDLEGLVFSHPPPPSGTNKEEGEGGGEEGEEMVEIEEDEDVDANIRTGVDVLGMLADV
ncbi:RNA dependent RNA polymerase-domain-containing protein [Biscogniauxia mediterranea]|nr:RNA dependent RNA polymerase-domain-containing protein [Biscogniauxia mediterranea]